MPPKVASAGSSSNPRNSIYMSSTGSAKKRSATGQVKYYAVRAGHTPGVFTNYADVQKSTTGFRGAVFKSFTTEVDAKAFAAGRDVITVPDGKKGAEKFYGVAKGHNPGVYTSWDEAQQQIQDFKGPRYKKFATRAEATEFVENRGQVVASSVAKAKLQKDATPVSKAKPIVKPKPQILAGEAEEEAQSLDDLDDTFPAKKKSKLTGFADGLAPNGHTDDATLKIYTDGSSLGNGKVGAIAGVGVYFGANSPLNISEPLPGPLQTNQRAELTAILRALTVAPTQTPVTIYTDSKYSIDCVTVWFQNWEKNNWMTSLKAPVQNKDLVQDVVGKIRSREKQGARTNFVWVKGHAGDQGNVAVDALAVAGARAAMAKRGRI